MIDSKLDSKLDLKLSAKLNPKLSAKKLDPQKLPRLLHTAAATGLAGALALTTAGCRNKTAEIAAVDATGQDPANANMAAPYTGGSAGGYSTGQPSSNGGTAPARVLGQSQSYQAQSSGESYETQTPAPIIRQAPAGSQPQYYPVPQAQGTNASYNGDGYPQTAPDGGYTDAEEAGEQALVETEQAPPPLPVYDQPPAPEDNYLWTPGYWNYASAGYYWVPGAWVAPPFYGALWTPPYWGYSRNHYLFHRGYWGPHVGYYGGVNYGFGYIGTGYYGGYWHDRDFFYNRSVTNVNVTNIHNVYNRTVVYDNRVYGPRPDNRISYNGGRGGLTVQPRPEEIAALHEAHYAPVPAQRENRIAAASNRQQFFAADGGRPANAFRAQPVGSLNHIAAAPPAQPFNRAALAGQPNQPGQPNLGNRGVEAGRNGSPATAGSFGNNNPRVGAGDLRQPGNVAQPTTAFRAGENGARPNQPGNTTQPNPTNRPEENGFRRGQPAQPTSGDLRQGSQPANTNLYNRPGNLRQPGTNPGAAGTAPGAGNNGRFNGATSPANGGRPDSYRNSTPAQPAPATRPNTNPAATDPFRNGNPQRGQTPMTQNAPGQPPVYNGRPQEFHRNAPTVQPNAGGRPGGFDAQRATQPAAQPQGRPNVENTRPAPTFTPRQETAPRAAAPAPAAQPRVEQPRAAAPAPSRPTAAPAGNAGGEHGRPH